MCVAPHAAIPSDPYETVFGPTRSHVALEGAALMPRSTRHRQPTRRPRRRRSAPRPASSLFDSLDSPPVDPSLLDDLVALVALGLLEQRSCPQGMVFALTELGRRTPSCGPVREYGA
jgi:hypothetical protein